MIGNAVPVTLAKTLALSIKEQLSNSSIESNSIHQELTTA